MTQDEEALQLNGALQMSDTLSNTEKVIETLTTFELRGKQGEHCFL